MYPIISIINNISSSRYSAYTCSTQNIHMIQIYEEIKHFITALSTYILPFSPQIALIFICHLLTLGQEFPRYIETYFILMLPHAPFNTPPPQNQTKFDKKNCSFIFAILSILIPKQNYGFKSKLMSESRRFLNFLKTCRSLHITNLIIYILKDLIINTFNPFNINIKTEMILLSVKKFQFEQILTIQ